MSIPIKRDKAVQSGACSIKKIKQTGLTLIELIIFIVIIGLAVAGVMVTYSTVVGKSADPVIRKQALAIAESLLLEIEQMGFTYCDANDPMFETAASANDCTTPQGLAPTPGQSRGNFDNVGDYAGYSADPVPDILGNHAIPGYSATVAIAEVGGSGAFVDIPRADVLQITVTVEGPSQLRIALIGHRTRFAPNSL